MSNIQLKVLPQFPAQVIGVAPIVVVKSGLTYTISLSGTSGFVQVNQVKQWLASLSLFDTIAATIPGAPQNALNIAWNGGGPTETTGPLLTSIFATLGYNPGQQAAAIATMLTFTY